MIIFFTGFAVGLILWILGANGDSVNSILSARAASYACNLGPCLAAVSLGLGVLHQYQKKKGAARVHLSALRYLIAYLTVIVFIDVVEREISIKWPIRYLTPRGIISILMIAVLAAWWRWSPAWRIHRRVKAHPNGYCHNCGYRLLPKQDRCPECGWIVTRRDGAGEAEAPTEPRREGEASAEPRD